MMLPLLFASCDKNRKENEPQYADSDLVRELTSLNGELIRSRPQTRKITKKEFLLVAFADVEGAWAGGKVGLKIGAKVGTILGSPITGGSVGAFVGAVGWGAVQSWLAYPDEEVVEVPDYDDVADFCTEMSLCLADEIDIDDLTGLSDVVFDPDESVESDSDEITEEMIIVEKRYLDEVSLSLTELMVGKKHNELLVNFQGASITPSPHKTRTRAIEETSTEENVDYESLAEAILDSDEMRQAYYETFESGEVLEDVSLPSVVTSLFSEVYQVYPESIQDVVYLINSYLERIDTSTELSEEEKSWIHLGMAVSLYSYNYWSQKQ